MPFISEQGKPMIFGENNEFGLMQEGFRIQSSKTGREWHY
jgi:hypothetical protein